MSLASKWLQRSRSLYLANPHSLSKLHPSHESAPSSRPAPSGGPVGAAPHERRQGRRTRREAADDGSCGQELRVGLLSECGQLCAAAIARLYRWTRHIPVSAVDAAIALCGLEHRLAALAIIEILASISRHQVARTVSAFGAGERGMRDHGRLIHCNIDRS